MSFKQVRSHSAIIDLVYRAIELLEKGDTTACDYDTTACDYVLTQLLVGHLLPIETWKNDRCPICNGDKFVRLKSNATNGGVDRWCCVSGYNFSPPGEPPCICQASGEIGERDNEGREKFFF